MGLSKLLSGAVNGIEAIPVEIEADASRVGDPLMVIVGLPDASVRESQHRVSTAISNSRIAFLALWWSISPLSSRSKFLSALFA